MRALVPVIAIVGLVFTAPGAGGHESPQALKKLLAGAPAPVGAEAGLPRILSAQDVERYRVIFALQKKGKMWAAQLRAKHLENRLLMGHVLAQRYLHRTHYRSKYKELRAWMAKYAEQPDAGWIYSLAMKRKPKGARAPRGPRSGRLKGRGEQATPARAPYKSRKLRTKAERQKVRSFRTQIRRHARRGRIKAAQHLLDHTDVRKLFDRVEIDAARSEIAAGYFLKGKDRKAFELASKSAARSGHHLPFAHWTAGLSAFRLGRYAKAAPHFEAVARAKGLSPWIAAGGAYWAARSHLVSRNPRKVNAWLIRAADHPRTFYGMLARHSLGLAADFNWDLPELDGAGLQALARTSAGKRAFALLQIGEVRRAEKELGNFRKAVPGNVVRTVLAIAGRLNMPSLTVRAANRLANDGGRRYDGAAYPAPDWRPKGGYKIDRALVFALIRQESRFNARAKSRAGARGLMQLMPGTARFMSRRGNFRGRARNQLYEPELNISLGQKYIQHLLKNEDILGNLILLTAAYNGGPGNLAKWRRRIPYDGDPLLFMESIPSSETRIFIERVLANLWVYRMRLGQPAPSLDAIAAGEWPTYTALDGADGEVAEDGRN